MGPKLRPRTARIKPDTYATAVRDWTSPSPDLNQSHIPHGPVSTPISTPPVYEIDLSLLPARRYVQVVHDHWSAIQDLRYLFDDILDSAHLPKTILHFVSRALLRKLYSKEQTEELRGISNVIMLPMYLLVAYNVLLDLFMGCTSGGARVQLHRSSTSRMMHFRTLDWAMPELRDVIVQYDYVLRPGGPVIASTISYVGFVGVLTGVRRELSASINFRPYHNDDSSFLANVKFRFQQLAVVLGFRPSIASILRDFILPRTTDQGNDKYLPQRLEPRPPYGHSDICTTLPGIRSTASYLIFCTPDDTVILEKDRKTAKILRSSTFIATTNHDVSYDTQQDADHTQASHVAHAKKATGGIGMQDVVEESIDRKECLVDKWEKWCRKQRRVVKQGRRCADGVDLEELKEWMMDFPTSNEQTHFVCVMDPEEGRIRWVRKFEEGEIEMEVDGEE